MLTEWWCPWCWFVLVLRSNRVLSLSCCCCCRCSRFGSIERSLDRSMAVVTVISGSVASGRLVVSVTHHRARSGSDSLVVLLLERCSRRVIVGRRRSFRCYGCPVLPPVQ
uniref:Putative secreted peptide n=1 Tax=Anopheles braziliensis TaxID=58242 RepID=A0A2M3ZWI0_9DIPT